MKNPPDELDQLLNEALATYSSAEPRPGIQQRVLRHIRTAAAPRRPWWQLAAIAVPALATLWLISIHHAVPVQAPAPPATLPPPVIAHVDPPVAPVPQRPVRTRRREAFPRPAPLSAEERALVALAIQFPQQAPELVKPAEPRPIEPIEIPKLEISPLPGDSQQ